MQTYRQCERCVMDTSDAEISFDEMGYCNHCTGYLERTRPQIYQGERSDRELAQLLERIKKAGRGRSYDAVIGISGGLDSGYAAHVAKQHALRLLAVHMDNGWNSTPAVTNIRNLARKLGLDYQSFVLDWDEFRDLQLSFFKASVPEIETPTDIAIPAALHAVAAQHGVRFIISGGNYATEGILPKGWHYDAKDVKYLRAIQKRFGTRRLSTFPTFGFQTEMYYKLAKGIRFIYLLNYVPYAKPQALATLEREVGWTSYGGKHHESRITGFVQSYVLPTKFGIDYRRATFSTQICAGSLSRNDALQELAKPPYDPTVVAREKEYVAKKLEVGLEEFEEILARPPRTFRDYPNNQPWLEFVYRTYRRYFS